MSKLDYLISEILDEMKETVGGDGCGIVHVESVLYSQSLPQIEEGVVLARPLRMTAWD